MPIAKKTTDRIDDTIRAARDAAIDLIAKGYTGIVKVTIPVTNGGLREPVVWCERKMDVDMS